VDAWLWLIPRLNSAVTAQPVLRSSCYEGWTRRPNIGFRVEETAGVFHGKALFGLHFIHASNFAFETRAQSRIPGHARYGFQ
jgi:hypothetical protein